jgi:hypothetical protein
MRTVFRGHGRTQGVLVEFVASALRSFAPLLALAAPAYLGARVAQGRPLARRETCAYLFDVTVYSAVLGGTLGVACLVVFDATSVGRDLALVVAGVGGLGAYALACWAAYVGTFRGSAPSLLGRLAGFRSE